MDMPRRSSAHTVCGRMGPRNDGKLYCFFHVLNAVREHVAPGTESCEGKAERSSEGNTESGSAFYHQGKLRASLCLT